MAKFSAYMRGEGTLGPTGDPAGFGEPNVSVTTLFSNQNAYVHVTTDPNSPDTAKIFNFEFGIPEGEAAGFATTQTASASSINSASTPTVSISTSGPETAKKFNFSFGIPKGVPAGYGSITTTVTTLASNKQATATITTNGPETAKNFTFNFGIPVGIPAGFAVPGVSVTTLAAENNPTISISTSGPETAKKFTFNFGIPAAKNGYHYINFTTNNGNGYNWEGNISKISRTNKLYVPISIYKITSNGNKEIAADFVMTKNDISYKADSKFNGVIYLATTA